MRPAWNGLSPQGHTGLRREEGAQLASISVDYYTRLEGRVPASAAVLLILLRALRLDDDRKQYLHDIAGCTDDRHRRLSQHTRPALRRLLKQLPTPAVVLGERLDCTTTPATPLPPLRTAKGWRSGWWSCVTSCTTAPTGESVPSGTEPRGTADTDGSRWRPP
ncbi:hypothetical protein GCM10010300_80370 [Streptomyces olivaceoviridis]|uniref:hypothetical protein n=1 Tax=Streptomyces olivaceoviridis TaxID=1921 RepID=UPI0019C16B93|nr:hypothetical protein GCM10010300_80370 [Streptomyces olivaceoviridis]